MKREISGQREREKPEGREGVKQAAWQSGTGRVGRERDKKKQMNKCRRHRRKADKGEVPLERQEKIKGETVRQRLKEKLSGEKTQARADIAIRNGKRQVKED